MKKGNGNGNERARVLAIRARDVKLIREVEIDAIGDILEIRGDAGQGKTTILQSIHCRQISAGTNPYRC